MWWGPGIDNFGGFGRFFGPFFANSGAGYRFWKVLGSVFDFFRHPRPLLSTKQHVWAGSGWFAAGFVVGSSNPAISDVCCGFGGTLGGFRADVYLFWSRGLVLGSVFDFFRHRRLLLSTKQSVWAGSEWSRVWFVVGSQSTTIRSKFTINSPHTLRSGSEWALTEINLTSRLFDRL